MRSIWTADASALLPFPSRPPRTRGATASAIGLPLSGLRAARGRPDVPRTVMDALGSSPRHGLRPSETHLDPVGGDDGAVQVDDRSRCASELPAERERAKLERVLHRCVFLAFSRPVRSCAVRLRGGVWTWARGPARRGRPSDLPLPAPSVWQGVRSACILFLARPLHCQPASRAAPRPGEARPEPGLV